MNNKYRIKVISSNDVDYAFEVLFGFGFVFTTGERINNYKSIVKAYTDFERVDWCWIINGYDDKCSNVFGVSSLFDTSINEFTQITLDDFLWEMVDEMRLAALSVGESSTPSEYLFRFTPPI